MSDNYTDDDFDTDSDSVDGEAGDIKSLRRAANTKKKVEQELAETKRLLAFARAGIDPDNPKMKYFVRGYDGELTVEAVREAATEAGFLLPAAPQQQPDREIAAAQDRIVTAASGAVYEDTSEASALARMEAAMEEGGIEAMLDVARQYGIPISTEM